MEEDQTVIRFGIMGCASIARKICRAITLAPNSTLHAIASRSLEKAKAFAAENGMLVDGELIRVHGSYNELLDDPLVDAVYMPLPTSLHVEWAVLTAYKKKHLLLEKPTALDSAQLEQILEACELNGVQFMDGTMWYHHPRTAKMKQKLTDSRSFGQIHQINCSSCFLADPTFLENNIRVKQDCDALGALGDLGWYCIAAILWATNYELPTFVRALSEPTLNSEGIILACNASLHWEQEQKINATFHCSFLSHVSMDLTVYSSLGTLRLDDLAIPHQENSASFSLTSGAKFVDHTEWSVELEEVLVETQLPQEALMIQEFANLVKKIKSSGCGSSKLWPDISRKTQLILDAVRKSIDLGLRPVYL